MDSGFPDMVRQVITETGVSPEQLELEMPAELLNEDPRQIHDLLYPTIREPADFLIMAMQCLYR